MNNDYYTDLTLEQYLLHELSESEYAEVADAIEKDSALRLRLLKIEESNHDFFTAHPVSLNVSLITRAVDNSQLKTDNKIIKAPSFLSQLFSLKNAFALSATLSVIVALFIFMPRNNEMLNGVSDQTSDVTRIKGSTSIMIYSKGEDGVTVLQNRSTVKSGDHLQIVYQNDNNTFGAILSIDGNGNITKHLPQDGEISRSIERGSRVILQNSYVLDNAPRFEKFYFFVSKKPFQIQLLRDRLKEAVNDNPESDPYIEDHEIQFKSFILYKE
ncbi:MAG: hypothetical protein JXK07_02195 [Spirochaetes bacterium]|nr:hypothetical protein [Spirochaetota bacterium]MBN2771864.1 hypothetical protein [Spirochaetota bacterium]